MAVIDFTGPLLLNELLCWMDGGSVTLQLQDSSSTVFTVEFCQIMNLDENYAAKYPDSRTPGSFLLNDTAVPIRSTEERILLQALKQVNLNTQSALEQQIIQERIAFVESAEYLRIAALMGRI